MVTSTPNEKFNILRCSQLPYPKPGVNVTTTCISACVDVMKNDMVLKKGTNMNEKWLDRVTKDLEKRTREVRGASNEVEKQQEDGMKAKYNNLTLRMENTLMDMSKALNYPTSQFEGGEELEKAMKKARVGLSTSFMEK
uniref:Uncharacterized protein n=1 Tax=Medicago truncatula TaxID=3880 RepID=A2Q4M2_MEDTR|nr:hypothetical protein MtrDRAFT_AC157506g3v2 [Medicago truncatula]